MNRNEVLKQFFGYDSFRSGQDLIVDSIMSGRDTLGVMPTGAGKSICYQVPALMMNGITIVISPLISLMQDQVTSLVQMGIRAAYINSSLSLNQLYAVIKNARNGVYKLIYVAPERLDSEIFLSFAREADISMITVDEAHCISQWGQDFRPSYLNIPQFAASLPKRPIMTAFTATATERVRNDIEKLLELNSPYSLVTGFDRKNLYFEVRHPSDRFADLKRLVKKYSVENRSGIIYCSTRKNVETVCEKLKALGYSAARYHAGLPEDEKHDNQEDFIYDRVKIMVATNAFGMGIDKSNVSFVIHYNMPKDVESYYQEAGRAGRDGSPSDCILLYNGQDVMTAKFLINKSFEESEQEPEVAEEVRRRDMKRLSSMVKYCTESKCLRSTILRYFGESAPSECGNCSCCCSDADMTDITVEAQKIMSCIFRAGQKYGIGMISEILRGSDNERIRRSGMDAISTYGIMKDDSDSKIKMLCDRLIGMGYIEKTEDEYPVLRLCPSALDVLKGNKKVTAWMPRPAERKAEPKTESVYKYDSRLMESLKELRAKIAATQGVPSYSVFTDSSLRDMCIKLPRTDSEFLTVQGVGAVKLERYGDRFMDIIRAYAEKNAPQKTETKEKKPSRMKTAENIRECSRQLLSCSLKASPEDVTVTVFTDRLIAESGANIACTPLRKAVTGWLVNSGYLAVGTDSRGKEEKHTTDISSDIGIYQEHFTSATTGMSYIRIKYTPQAQQFIIDRLSEIMEYAEKNAEE